MATAPPTRFVTPDQVTRDLLNAIQASPDMTWLTEQLARLSSCDFKAELLAGLLVTDGTSLETQIRTFIRNNGGDTTALKSAQRLYLNSKASAFLTSDLAVSRTTAQLTKPLTFAYSRDVVQDKACLPKCYTLAGNVLTFTRPARIMVISNLNWGVWPGTGAITDAPPAPSWRFAAGGNNRIITAALNFLIEGSLSGGALSRKLQPQNAVFYEEEIIPASKRRHANTTVLDVLTPSSNQGRIEKLTLEIERSPYVISFGTQVDNIGFFKNTAAGTEDLANYIEIVEL